MKDVSCADIAKNTTATVENAVSATANSVASSRHDIIPPQNISEAGRCLRLGALTSEALTQAYLVAIKQLQPKLNMFITITEDHALQTARAMDAELKAGKDRGPLHGIPIVYKDLYDTAGIRTTVGSEFHRNRIPQEDATVVRRLKQAGSVMLGKTNMNEFAGGVSGINKYFGNTCNPWDTDRSPGGSSSGTGVAIAAGVCLGGMGSDTGGSIRVPASWLNLVGVRPTYGRVSLAGVYPRSPSLDVAGPLARSVADAALLLNAIAGHDPMDHHSLNVPPEDFTAALKTDIRGLRLGVIENYTFRDVDPDISTAISVALDKLAALGAEIVTVRIPLFSGPLEYNTLFDIQLYECNQVLGEMYRTAANKDEFGPYIRGNIEKGMKITRETYEKALRDRPVQVTKVKEVFQQIDALLTPTMPTVAPLLTETSDVYERGRQFTLPFSFTGLPSISVPCGLSPGGLPTGLQIVSNELQECLLVRIAAAFERATEFHTRRPMLHFDSAV